jgi:hypothetical protein
MPDARISENRNRRANPGSFDDLADAAADRCGDAPQSVFLDFRSAARSRAGEGQDVGIDATTLEASAAIRSIVRRDTGESYEGFLKRLVQESGIETPTKEDLARLDRKRKNKASNEDWVNPHDRDAHTTKMRDGRTHLAHKSRARRGDEDGSGWR